MKVLMLPLCFRFSEAEVWGVCVCDCITDVCEAVEQVMLVSLTLSPSLTLTHVLLSKAGVIALHSEHKHASHVLEIDLV